MPDRLTALIHQKLKYYGKAAEIATDNIARSELKGEKLKDIKPFQTILRQAQSAKDPLGRRISDIKDFDIKKTDIVHTDQEINREMSVMQMTQMTREHSNLVQMLKSFDMMLKTMIGK